MQVKVTYVEMLSRPAKVITPPRDRLRVVRLECPTVAEYRRLYTAVGKDWNWLSRRKMSDENLAKIITDAANEIHVLLVDEVEAGFVELDRRSPPEIEITQFGLTPAFIGKGLGAWFLQWSIDRAWSYSPTRLWLHTCTLDHPRALPNYLRAGFTIYKEEIIERDL